MSGLNVLTYTAQITLPSGQTYTYSGSQTLAATTTAALQAAATAMGVDIGNQLANGTANDPSLAAQQTTNSVQS
jgi:hypothetical protein